MLLYVLLFFFNKFPISNIDKFSCFLLTFVASQLFMIAIETKPIIDYFKNKIRLFFILLILYVSFASIGNYLFLNPVNITSISNWLYLILFSFWIIPIIISVLYLLEYFQSKIASETKNEIEDQRKKSLIWFLFFSICVIAGTLYLIAYNLAIMSFDSYDQLKQAIGVTPLVNWHPVFHTLIIRLFISIIPSPSFVAIFQILFFSTIISTFMVVLYNKGIKLKFLVVFCVMLTMIPTNGIHIVTLWKDIPYSISLLWLTLLFAKIISRDQLYTKSILFIIEITLALICVYFFRQNGIVVYIFSVIALIIIFLKRNQFKPLWGIVFSLIIILMIQFPLYKALNVKSATQGSKYIGLLNDIAGVYFSRGDISKETEDFLEKVVDIEEFRGTHSFYWADSQYYTPELHKIKSIEFIGMYIDTFLRNPVLMTNNILCRLDMYWNITKGKRGVINVINFTGCDCGSSGLKNIRIDRRPIFLTSYINRISGFTVTYNPLLVIFWRFGIWIVFLFTTFLFVIKNKKFEILLLGLPILTNILSLALSSGWMDYRYGWSIFITVPFVMLFSISYSPLIEKYMSEKVDTPK